MIRSTASAEVQGFSHKHILCNQNVTPLVTKRKLCTGATAKNLFFRSHDNQQFVWLKAIGTAYRQVGQFYVIYPVYSC